MITMANLFLTPIKNNPLWQKIQHGDKKLALNSLSLMAVNWFGSLLGFLFWKVCAYKFSPTEVGLASALIASMMLVGNLASMGLSTTVIRFLPTMGEEQESFINTSVIFLTLTTLMTAFIFVIGIPIWSADLAFVAKYYVYVIIFIVTSVTFNLAQYFDQFFVAFEKGPLYFFRRVTADILRLIFVMIFPATWGAMATLSAMGLAAVMTFAVSVIIFIPKILPHYQLRPHFTWSLLHRKISYSLTNHFSQFLWNTPFFTYSLIIITILGSEANAYFHISWMLANVIFMFPIMISTVAFARASHETKGNYRDFWQIVAFTLVLLLPITIIAIIISPIALAFFGQEYVINGQLFFAILMLSVFPYAINMFTIVYYNITQNIWNMFWFPTLVAVTAISLVIFFANLYGLVGVGWGWLTAQLIGVTITVLYHNPFVILNRLKTNVFNFRTK